MKVFLKILLAFGFLTCLLEMPYYYYQLIRYISMILFGWFAYENYFHNRKRLAYFYLGSALLFQPIFKIALGRYIWNIVDVLFALILIFEVLFVIKYKEVKEIYGKK